MAVRYIIAAVIGYLLGNIASGVLVGRAFGLKDIRKVGSGNAGTTNVLRNLGWLPSVLTLIGDCLKGLAACLIGRRIGGEACMLIAGVAAIVGHDFPVFFGFRGGKGIATSLGVILMMDARIALALLVVQIAAVAVTRYMSIASLTTTVAFPVLTTWLYRAHENRMMYIIVAVVMSALSLFGHRGNILRLIRGEENKLDFRSISEKSKSLFKKNRHN